MKQHKQPKKEEEERFEKVTAGGNVLVKIYTRQKAGGYTVHEFADYSSSPTTAGGAAGSGAFPTTPRP